MLFCYNEGDVNDTKRKGIVIMRVRKQELGDRNIVGARVQKIRRSMLMKQKDLLAQLQVRGIDMNATGLSKLEGQLRHVTDYELVALVDILNVSFETLMGLDD